MKIFFILLFFSNFLFSQEIFYGSDKNQSFDIYLPNSNFKKIVVLVHGGAWKYGDKSSFSGDKINFFLTNNFAVVNSNYRLFPQANIEEQLSDLKTILFYLNKNFSNKEIILIGHSAGAHLVSLLNFESDLKLKGVISLDSAAIDLIKIIGNRHFSFYDEVFGSNLEDLKKYSPIYKNNFNQISPMLLVCSSERKLSCSASFSFKEKMSKFNNIVFPIQKNHSEISSDIGIDKEYSLYLLDSINNF